MSQPEHGASIPSLCDHGGGECADAFDVPVHHVAGLQECSRRVSNASRGAGADDFARFEGHHLGNEGDQCRHGEDHRARRRVLLHLAIEFQGHLQPLRIRQSVRGQHTRTHRAERVQSLTYLQRCCRML